MVIGAVLGILAVPVDLGLEPLVEPLPAQGAPGRRRGVVCQRQPGGKETSRFGQEVVVILRTSIDQRGRNACRMRGNSLTQTLEPLRRAVKGPGEHLRSPD